MPSKNRFECFEGEIHIFRDTWNQAAMTTFCEDYYDELTSVTWTANNGYLFDRRLGLLHRYIYWQWCVVLFECGGRRMDNTRLNLFARCRWRVSTPGRRS